MAQLENINNMNNSENNSNQEAKKDKEGSILSVSDLLNRIDEQKLQRKKDQKEAEAEKNILLNSIMDRDKESERDAERLKSLQEKVDFLENRITSKTATDKLDNKPPTEIDQKKALEKCAENAIRRLKERIITRYSHK